MTAAGRIASQPSTRPVDVPSGRPATVPTPSPGDARLARLSLNQKTTNRWSVRQAAEACAQAGVPAIGLWREPVGDVGVAEASRIVEESGLRVSSLCRGGFLTETDDDLWSASLDDNRRAIDEAAALGAACLVIVVGGLPAGSRDLRRARCRVAEGIAALIPRAAAAGVRLALEPMHPIYAADRGVISTLGQALDLAEQFAATEVGIAVDTFHVWWDPELDEQLARARGRIACYQLADWITPLPADAVLSRGMPGDGHIDFLHINGLVDAAGYDGDIEVEIFNAQVWAAPPDEVLSTLVRRYASYMV